MAVASEYAHLAATITPDVPALAYLGSRWLPRHVVLVLRGQPGELAVYDPSLSHVQACPVTDFVRGTVSASGWDTLWAVIRPQTAQMSPGAMNA